MDGHRTSAMVPHADMLNHYRPRETKWTFDEERQAFTITTLQSIPAGAQVYDSYGQKCNHRFLLNYGFAVEDNRELDGFCPNEVPIELSVSPEDALYEEKLEFWTRGEGGSGMGGGNHHHHHRKAAAATSDPPPIMMMMKRVRVCVSNNENTRLLFSLLRALACNHEELMGITTSTTTTTPPISSPPNSSSSNTSMHHDHSHHPHHATTTMHSHSSSSSSRVIFGGGGGGGGIPTSSSSLASGNSLTSTTTSSFLLDRGNGAASVAAGVSFFRSCRDIRHPISLRNERSAMMLLLEVVSRALSKYPTTLAQDVADLMNERAYPRFSNVRHAKIQLRGEKQVLHHFARWAKTALQVMHVLEQEIQEEQIRMQEEQDQQDQQQQDSQHHHNNHHHHHHHCSSGVEVQLGHSAPLMTTTTPAPVAVRPNFEQVIREMEQQEDGNGGLHHTIVRYCADVLGSLRREELKNIRRKHTTKTTTTTAYHF